MPAKRAHADRSRIRHLHRANLRARDWTCKSCSPPFRPVRSVGHPLLSGASVKPLRPAMTGDIPAGLALSSWTTPAPIRPPREVWVSSDRPSGARHGGSWPQRKGLLDHIGARRFARPAATQCGRGRQRVDRQPVIRDRGGTRGASGRLQRPNARARFGHCAMFGHCRGVGPDPRIAATGGSPRSAKASVRKSSPERASSVSTEVRAASHARSRAAR